MVFRWSGRLRSGIRLGRFYSRISDKEFDFTSDIDSYEGSVSIDTNSINSGSCGDNVTWSVSGSVVTITGNGKMKDFSYDEVKPWNDATEVIVENGVTGIGEVDFYIGLM